MTPPPDAPALADVMAAMKREEKEALIRHELAKDFMEQAAALRARAAQGARDAE